MEITALTAAFEKKVKFRILYDKLCQQKGSRSFTIYSGSNESRIYKEYTNAISEIYQLTSEIVYPPTWGDFTSINRSIQHINELNSPQELGRALCDAWSSLNRNMELEKISGLATGGAFIEGIDCKNAYAGAQQLLARFLQFGFDYFNELNKQYAAAKDRDTAILKARFPENYV